MRVVLYAEGPTELGGENDWLPAPTQPMQSEHLGPAHILTQRALAHVRELPQKAITFQSPLVLRSRKVRGSDLLKRRELRQLLTWLDYRKRPELVVVLVDQDGETGRKQMLEEFTVDLAVPRVIGVPIREFESWLIGDGECLREVLPDAGPVAIRPETLPPGSAKAAFSGCCDGLSQRQIRRVRRLITEACDLQTLATKCRSFERFLQDLRSVTLAALPLYALLNLI